MTGLDALRTLGYAVDVDPESGTAAVRGFGVAVMVDPDDAATLAQLANPKTHAVRRLQHDRASSPREAGL